MDITGMVSASDVLALASTLAQGLNVLPQQFAIGALSSAGKSIVLTNGTSTLLAVGASVATERTALIVRNDGDVQCVIIPKGASSVDGGLPIEPGQMLRIDVSSASVELYGRSTGYSCQVTVWEV